MRVQLLGTDKLQLREVEVFDQSNVNVALKKVATQISTLDAYTASRAVNGDKTSNDFSHTDNVIVVQGKYHWIIGCNILMHNSCSYLVLFAW